MENKIQKTQIKGETLEEEQRRIMVFQILISFADQKIIILIINLLIIVPDIDLVT